MLTVLVCLAALVGCGQGLRFANGLSPSGGDLVGGGGGATSGGGGGMTSGATGPRVILVANPNHIPADNLTEAVLTATVLDANGNANQGQLVTFDDGGIAGDQINPGAATTNALGVATVKFRSSSPAVKTVHATSGALSATTLVIAGCSSAPTYSAAITYAVPGEAQELATADFDRDGHLDLAIIAGNGVSVFHGLGNGSFTGPSNYAADNSPLAVNAGDLTHDGFPDLIAANTFTNDLSVLINRTNGVFFRAVDYPTGPTPDSTAIADFNNDGNNDVAVASQGNTTVAVLLGKGDGTFAPAKYTNTFFANGSLVAADFNGDSRMDLAIAQSQYVTILKGAGNGNFITGYSMSVPGPYDLQTGDLNNDGSIDIVVSNNSPTEMSVLLGNGDATFRPPVNYTAGGDPLFFRVADLNGDGRLDVVTTDYLSNNIYVLVGYGDGTLGPAVAIPNVSVQFGMEVGDFNGDGHLDLAAGNYTSNTMSVLLYQSCP